MKILIVDDNTTNRMLLDAYLDDYMESNSTTKFTVDMAKDGVEAVQMVKETQYNLIFMDINMPNMDGVEASKVIRSLDATVMIIAVSAAEDEEKKIEILNNGAEDYISKPVDADIFHSRLKNYILLSQARKKENVNAKGINLYTNKVFSRHTTFLLDSEDSVAEFWEFFLLNVSKKSDHLSDVIRVIVALVEKQMSINKSNNRVYSEESEEKQYLTLVGISEFSTQTMELFLKKNNILGGYKLTAEKLSFELLKTKQYEETPDADIMQERKEEVLKTSVGESVPETDIALQSQTLQVFDYLDADDLLDLEEYADNLNSLMLLVGGGALEAEDILEMCTYLDQISALLAPYTEVYAISTALGELSACLSSHIDAFQTHSATLGPMCNAFSNDLLSWIKQSFHTGAPSVDFMNDTIVVNSQTIASMLKMDEAPAADDDFDDIFDF